MLQLKRQLMAVKAIWRFILLFWKASQATESMLLLYSLYLLAWPKLVGFSWVNLFACFFKQVSFKSGCFATDGRSHYRTPEVSLALFWKYEQQEKSGRNKKKQKQNLGTVFTGAFSHLWPRWLSYQQNIVWKNVTSSYRTPKPAAFTCDGPFIHISLHLLVH